LETVERQDIFGIFARTMVGLAANRGKTRTVAIAATYLEGVSHSDRFGDALKDKGRLACIPLHPRSETARKARRIPQATRQTPQPYRGNPYRDRVREAEDWRPAMARDDRCPNAAFSASALAATVIYRPRNATGCRNGACVAHRRYRYTDRRRAAAIPV